MHRSLASAIALSLALGGISQHAFAKDPRLIADFAKPPSRSRTLPASLLPLGDRVVFLTNDSTVLWASDGTSEGTRPLAELNQNAVAWGTVNSLAFFGAGPYDSFRVWRSDGTVAGTYPLTRELPLGHFSNGGNFVIARNRVYFFTCEEYRCSMWSTDGTLEGTRQVGTGREPFSPSDMVAFGDDIYFLANGRLWHASAQADLVELVDQTHAYSCCLVALGRVFFLALDGNRLWSTDGTAAQTVPGIELRADKLLGEFLGKVWFVAFDQAHGEELWSTDGTAAGTRRASDFFNPQPFDVDEYTGVPAPHLAQLGDRLLFNAKNQVQKELWTTKGDVLSTQPLTGCAVSCPAATNAPFAVAGGRAAFLADLPGPAAELWITDGTGPGTQKTFPVAFVKLADVSAVGGLFFFSLTEGGNYPYNRFLYSNDGTLDGTLKLGSTNNPYEKLSPPVAAGDRIFFPAFDDQLNGSLWISRGRKPPTLVFSQPLEAGGGDPQPMATVNRLLLFLTCSDGGCPEQLWSTNGSSIDQVLEDDVLGRSCEDRPVVWMAPAGKRVLLYAAWHCTLNSGSLVIGTDGTRRGLRSIPIPAGWNGERPVPFKGKAFFTVEVSSAHSTAALWSSDGTAAGTKAVASLSDGRTGRLVTDGARLCFPIRTFAVGDQVWCSDGTSRGTKPFGPRRETLSAIALLGPRLYFLAAEQSDRSTPAMLGSLSQDGSTTEFSLTDLGVEGPLALTAAGGRLWFAARLAGDPILRWWLWTSDGTREGTRRLPTEVPRSSFSTYYSEGELPLTVFQAKVYFAGEDDRHGRELWSSDGTVAGTAPVLDLAPGPADGAPLSNLVIWQGRLYFAGNDMEHGVELWSSDGTAAGTRIEFDLFPGPLSSRPDHLQVLRNRLYFGARDEEHGRELWALEE
ncbi:MAG TPA: hypothetical protein VGG03_07155 [Thermoanaerobaculia bacterium]|jgi:ELWxxDGT repeat protein